MTAPPGVYQGAANVIAALMLLLEFGMLRQALVRDQVRLYAAQSALISVLAIVIAADRNLPDLYVLAALSGALKVVVVPLVLRRLLGAPVSEDAPGVAGSYTLNPASAVLACIGLAAFGFFSLGGLRGVVPRVSTAAGCTSRDRPPRPSRWRSRRRWSSSRSG